MTSAGMPRDIDRILDAWFDDGPTLAADRVVSAALTQVEQVPQAGPMLGGFGQRQDRQRTAMWQLLAATVAIAFTLVGIGFAAGILRIDRNPRPVPIDSSQPTASSNTGEFRLFSSVADGYELLIPNAWVEVSSAQPDARKWAGPDGELMISYGTSIFDGGEVSVCAPSDFAFVDCTILEHGYSVPFDADVDGVGPISLEVWLDRCDGGCPLATTNVGLDGEPAAEQRTVIEDRQLTYVTTFHNRRPIVVYWNELRASADEERIDTMRSSFRFLDPRASESQAPFVDPTELVAHVDPDAGYELLVPRFWEEGARQAPSGDGIAAGVIRFGSGSGAATRGDPGLTISVGQPDGSVFLCQPLCERIVVRTLDELGAAITSRHQGAGYAPAEVTGEMRLGGEAARWERPDYQQETTFADLGIGAMTGGGMCLGCPEMRYHAFAFHNGRPVVLAFDYWNIAFERLQTDYVAQIIESFHYLD